MLGDTVTALAEFADEIVARWFATPVKPMLMRAGAGRGGVMATRFRVSHRTTYEYSQPMTDGYTLAFVTPRPTP